MRYFTKALWTEMNDDCESIRLQAQKKWDHNNNCYMREFESTKQHLPRRFVSEFLRRHSLHDYVILGIAITKKDRRYSCVLQLNDGTDTILLCISALDSLNLKIDSFNNCMLGKLRWGYCEFELTQSGRFKLSVLCDLHNELQFEFESIKIINQ